MENTLIPSVEAVDAETKKLQDRLNLLRRLKKLLVRQNAVNLELADKVIKEASDKPEDQTPE